jgi:hypothetical protein
MQCSALACSRTIPEHRPHYKNETQAIYGIFTQRRSEKEDIAYVEVAVESAGVKEGTVTVGEVEESQEADALRFSFSGRPPVDYVRSQFCGLVDGAEVEVVGIVTAPGGLCRFRFGEAAVATGTSTKP